MELILSFLIVLAASIFGTPFLLCFWRYYLCPKKKTDKVKDPLAEAEKGKAAAKPKKKLGLKRKGPQKLVTKKKADTVKDKLVKNITVD